MIRIKAWDKRRKKFVEPYNFISSITGETVLELKNSKNVEFIQSTNVFDKNGIEVFEGDIVIKIFLSTISYYVVKLEDCSFTLIPLDKDDEPFYMCEDNNIEVVGNKFENPELIKGAKL